MIRTYRHKGLKQLFETGKSAAVAQDLARRAKIVVDYLDAAITVYDMGAPGLRLHELKGERKERHRERELADHIRLSRRRCLHVNLEDYH